MKNIRVGVIGLGVGIKHFNVLNKIKFCSIIAVCDFNKKKLNSLKLKNSEIIKTTNYKDLLKMKLDLVIIASYDNFHSKQIIEFVKNGSHIFIEKPMCLNKKEFKNIKNALEKHPKIKFSSNFVLRTKKTLKFLKRIIERKKMGKLYYLEGDYNFGRLEKITKGWRGKIPFYSVMHGGGIHLIDLINWMHMKKIKKVFADGNNLSTKHSRFKFNDLITSTLKFEDGSLAKVSANFGSVAPHHHILNVYGTKGTYFHNINGDLFYTSRNPSLKPQRINFKNNYVDQGEILKSFLSSLITKKKCIVSKSIVFDSMAVSLAIEDSIKKKKWIKVRYN